MNNEIYWIWIKRLRNGKYNVFIYDLAEGIRCETDIESKSLNVACNAAIEIADAFAKLGGNVAIVTSDKAALERIKRKSAYKGVVQ